MGPIPSASQGTSVEDAWTAAARELGLDDFEDVPSFEDDDDTA